MTALTDLTIHDAASLLAARQVSPVELVRAHLDRIEQLNPTLNCYLLVTAEQALAQARQAEIDIAQGNYRGPLHGIPVALKDLAHTRGVRTTAGSPFLADHIPTDDAAVVEKLTEAGAISLGKLNMHEWALGVIGDNPHFGACRNPWDQERICGGSSSGAGAALAAGLCMGALGTDTGGSIRLPAALCGIVGLKPTRGRVSLRGIVPLSWNLDHAGPMARSVRDTALLLNVMAGFDPDDPYSADVPAEDFTATLESGVRGWRIGWLNDDYVNTETTHPEVLAAYHAAVDVFRDLGATVEPISIPSLPVIRAMNRQLTATDAATYHREHIAQRPDLFGDDVLWRMRNELLTTAVDYAQVRHQQAIMQRAFDRDYGTYDAILLPTTPFPAVHSGIPDEVQYARTHSSRLVGPLNFLGVPVISVPCGFSREGLPLGLQLVGRRWREVDVLPAAFAYEQATGWHTRRPPLEATTR